MMKSRRECARRVHAQQRDEAQGYLDELRAHLVSHPKRKRIDRLVGRLFGCALAMGDAYRVTHPDEPVA